jgi:hypothetical protein
MASIIAPIESILTLGDLLNRLGGISADRIETP